MKKIFFGGSYFENGGPWEVNANLVENLDNDILRLTKSNRVFRLLEYIVRIFLCDVVVFSGITTIDFILVYYAILLRKKIVYIMHGCLSLEFSTNNYKGGRIPLLNERILLKKADLILCVSNRYRNLMANRYPIYANKMDVLTNGINWGKYKNRGKTNELERDSNKIILMGGGRITKRNLIVCRAVDILNKKNSSNYYVEVYGKYNDYDDSPKILQCKCVKVFKEVSHEEMLNVLCHSKLFVQSSEFESFSLGIVEALICGADILLSHNVGALDIIPATKECDIIYDVFNINEIVDKIENVLNHSNNSRLIKSIDEMSTSSKNSANQLISIINNYLK